MSVRIMSLVFENQELSSTEKLIMLALADHANDEGKSVYPSQSRIARKTSLARPTVNKHIQGLIDNNYLYREGYREDRNGALEVSINVTRLVEGVTEDDTAQSEGVTDDDRGVSSRMTGGVTEDDTNHQLTINFNHQSIKGLTGDLFNDCQKIYEQLKKRMIPSPSTFAVMIDEFKKNDVSAEDYFNAIKEQDATGKYKRAINPDSYASWALGIADKRKNPMKYAKDKKTRADAEKMDAENYKRSWAMAK